MYRSHAVLAAICLLTVAPGSEATTTHFPGSSWDEATPESQNVDSLKLQSAMDSLAAATGSSVGCSRAVVVRNGRMIWKGDQASFRQNEVWSITKNFTGSCLGLLLDDGVISVDTKAPTIVPTLAALYPDATVFQFATMTAGYDAPGGHYRRLGTIADGSYEFWIPTTPLFAPGSHFQYWDDGLNAYGNLLTQAAQQDLESLFASRIGNIIGITNWDWPSYRSHDGFELNCASGNLASGVSISAEDLARLGHLYLNGGNWDGTQVLSSSFVTAATTVQVPASTPHFGIGLDGAGIYGYHWWLNGVKPDGQRIWPDAPEGAYKGTGYKDNELFVIPEWNMVIVRLGEDSDNLDYADDNAFLKSVGEALTDPVLSAHHRDTSVTAVFADGTLGGFVEDWTPEVPARVSGGLLLPQQDEAFTLAEKTYSDLTMVAKVQHPDTVSPSQFYVILHAAAEGGARDSGPSASVEQTAADAMLLRVRDWVGGNYEVVSETLIPGLTVGEAYNLRVSCTNGALKVWVNSAVSANDLPLAEVSSLSATSGYLRFGVAQEPAEPELLKVEYLAVREYADICDVTIDADGTAWFSQVQDGDYWSDFNANWPTFSVQYNTARGSLLFDWPTWLATVHSLGPNLVREGADARDHLIYGISGFSFGSGNELVLEYQGEKEGELVP